MLIAVLEQSPQLIKLNLGSNQLTAAQSTQVIATLASQAQPLLEELYITGNFFEADGAIKLATLVATSPKLNRVGMSDQQGPFKFQIQ